MIGSIAIALVFAASIAGITLYTLVARGRGEFLTAARIATHLAIVAVFIAAGTLLYYIFGYHFEINYVYEHVSLKLSKLLLFSTFYASQEGSFMLWMLWTAIIAIFLMGYAARQRYEAPVMAVFLTVLAFIAIMLIAKSPFESIYAAHPGDLTLGQLPKDGKGLNPSLENLWIVIHPPMLFLGFSLLAVPFSFAIAGLMKRDFQGWVVTSMPWTLAAGMVLGFGVMLGGFWAYETLGWGGFWGWDPVENASILPWLITVACAHTMLTQKRTGGLVKTNIAMTLLAFALVLYGSFLTRSGVLSDASVHSFADPGAVAFRLLFGALIFFIGGSIVVFAMRWKQMSAHSQDYKILSRETSLSIASAILGASTLVIFIGTSAPLISKKVDTDFYNSLHIPIAIALLIINALSLLLKWKQSSVSEMVKKGLQSFVTAVIATIAVFALGVRDFRFIAIVFGAFFALFVNAELAFKILRSHWNVKVLRTAPTGREFVQRLRTALFLSLGVSVIALLIATAGDYNLFYPIIERYFPYFFILLSVIVIAFVTVGYPEWKTDTNFMGAYVAHMGVSVFMLGVVGAACYSQSHVYQLPQDEPVKIFGGKYTVTYRGHEDAPNEHYYWMIDVKDADGKDIGTAKPLWFMTDFNNHESPIINPSILKYATHDLYFTNQGYDHTGGVPRDTLGKGQVIDVMEGKLRIKFINFDFPQEEKAKMLEGKPFRVKASAQVTDLKTKGAPTSDVTLSVTRNLQTGEANEEDVVVPGTHYHVQLAELKPDMANPANSKVVIRYFDTDAPAPKEKEIITTEIFIKPWINLVWLGIIVLVGGFGFAVVRRRREALLAITRAERAYERTLEGRSTFDPSAPPVPSSKDRPILTKQGQKRA